jgi:hypothetical protein
MSITHEITGHDDEWEYAIVTVQMSDGRPIRPDAPEPFPIGPPGEGWVARDDRQHPRQVNATDGTARLFYWKRPLAYSILNRETVAMADRMIIDSRTSPSFAQATDPTTEQLKARNGEVVELRTRLACLEKIAAQRLADLEAMSRAATMEHEKREELRKRHSEALDKVGDLTRHLQLSERINEEHIAKIKKYEAALIEFRRGWYPSRSKLEITDRELFDRIYCMIDENIAWRAWQTTDVRTRTPEAADVMRAAERAAIVTLANEKPAPIPMFLTCPMCNTRHIDEGEFATKSHHTHSCQTCGLTWRPAVVPTVGVQYLPGFKDGVK